MDSNQLIAYDEPNLDGSVCHTVLTIIEAIERQTKCAAALGYKYQDSAEALDDFMAVNWAYLVGHDGITKIS